MRNRKGLFAGVWLPILFLTALMAGCASDDGGTLQNCDNTPPAVVSTIPVNGATDVSLNGDITATFSETMDLSTITTTTFTLRHGTTSVSGTVTYTGVTATLDPESDLTASTVYTATITNGVRDLAGNTMINNYVWTFTTGTTADVSPPTVVFTVPANGATGISLNGNLAAIFSEAMNPFSITPASFTLQHGTTSVSGTVTYIGVTANFDPESNLTASTVYTATITTGVRDLAGNTMVNNYVWTFTTGTTPDVSPPVVISTVPAIGATGVSVNGNITATFSEVMNPLTITTATFTLQNGTTFISGTVTYTGVTATFNPASDLTPSTDYTATITAGVRDLAGNAMVNDYVWTFAVGATSDVIPPVVTSTVPARGASGVSLSGNITATFSEAMDPLTITTATMTLYQGTTQVSGTVIYTGVTASFNPASDLTASTVYTATITTGVKDLAGNAMVNNYVWPFTTGTTGDVSPPVVISTVPANGVTGVSLNGNLAAIFSEAMDPLTITTSTMTLQHGTTFVSGAVTYTGVTATFNPASDLTPSTDYTATITTGVRDLAGNAMVNEYVWTFTTGAITDMTPPVVISTIPVDGATGVSLNGNIAAIFSEAMDPLSITTTTFTLRHGTTSVSGTVTYTGVTASFDPANDLTASTVYTGTITTGVRDVAGNAMVNDYVWTFTTGSAADVTPPTVVSTVPVDGATGVLVTSNIAAAFSEAMDPLTITTATMTLQHNTTFISGAVTYSGVTASFNPANDLAENTDYTATITTGVRDLAGNEMVSSYVWTFTTGATGTNLDPVNLGSAASYGVLAGSTVTNTGPTIVNGDLGVSPGTAVTGFPPGVVNGTIHAGDADAAQAKLDLTTAYNDAAGRTTAPITVSGNLGGQTLAPGLYKSTSSLEISSGDLTLDAQGDENAVWIFQMASTLTTTTGRQVTLSGGAQARNIYWQVGSSATLGTNSIFKGNILADQSVTLTTGATLDGRALTRIAAVALDSNIITVPAP